MRWTKASSIIISIILLLLSWSSSNAVIEAVEFDNAELLERYQSLIAELRCTVCQNQNLADSDADLAKDLRRKTEEMLKSGQSDQEILSYMSDRYGDFVLYRPPLSASTSLLWLGPFALLFIAATCLFISIKRKQLNNETQFDHSLQKKQQERIEKARDLLKN